MLTIARLDLSVKQLAVAALLIAVAGSSYAASAATQSTQLSSPEQQAVKPLSKSQATRLEIMQKVARHEPISYTESLYLR